MAEGGNELIGRQEHLAALRGWRGAGLVALRGQAYSGRSALLARFGRDLRADGVRVLDVDGARDRRAWDRFGVLPVLAAVRDAFEYLRPGPELAPALEAVQRAATPEAYGTSQGRSALHAELGRLLAVVGADGPLTLLVDDADRIPAPVFALTAARRAGHTVVAALRTGPVMPAHLAEVCEAADEIVELRALEAEPAEALLRRIAGMPADPALTRALRASLGRLFGCPGTLIETMADLRARGRLVRIQRHLCLRGDEPIGLAAGHPLLEAVDRVDGSGADLIALAAGPTGLRVDDVPALAWVTGRTPAACGSAVDALVVAGVFDCSRDGLLTVRCPALGVAVRERAGAAAIRALHRRVGRHLRGNVRLTGRDDLSALADHVAAAGPDWPRDPELAAMLHDEAARVVDTDPSRAIPRYRAAWRHAGPGHGRRRVQTDLIRLIVQAGDYAELAAFVEEIVAEGEYRSPGSRADLARVAALAALHLGRRVSPAVRSALAGVTGGPCPLRACESWWGADETTVQEFVACFAPMAAGWSGPASADRAPERIAVPADIELAFELRMLTMVFSWLLGPDYRIPETGPLAGLHRLVAGYKGGEWADALTAARALQLDDAQDPVVTMTAVAVAVEICAMQDRERRARGWLEPLPDVLHDRLKAWCEARIASHAAEPVEALPQMWQTYCEVRGGPPVAVWTLLMQVADLARASGDPWWARLVLAESQARCADRTHGALGEEYDATIRGLLRADEAELRRGIEMCRSRESLPDLARHLLAAAGVAADPEPLLREAFEIAERIGATRVRKAVRRAMQTHGVTAPTTGAHPERLSELETRLVELIRRGRTNRQIAVAVTMSEKTVENHLTRLFGKTGCRTRHELVAASLDGRLAALTA